MYDDPGQEKGEAAVADEGDGGLYDEPAFNQDDRENPMYQSQDHVEDGDGGGYLDVQPDGEDDDENDDDEDFDDDEDEDEDYDDDDDDDGDSSDDEKDGKKEDDNEDDESDDDESDDDSDDESDTETEDDDSESVDSGIDKEDDEEEEEEEIEKSKDVNEGKTLFIRNVSFNSNEESLRGCFEVFGQIVMCKLVEDFDTGRPRGTAFVKYSTAEEAAACLARVQDASKPPLTCDGREMNVAIAVDRREAMQLMKSNAIKRETREKEVVKDKRNLYLLREGIIMSNTPAWNQMSTSDQRKRQNLEKESKIKSSNPNLSVSQTRVSVHNLPVNLSEAELKILAKETASKENFKLHVLQSKIVRTNDRLGPDGKPRSKGFGFLELSKHEEALAVIRCMNNNPSVFTKEKRPIVMFAWQDARAIRKLNRRREMRKQKTENPAIKELKNTKKAESHFVKSIPKPSIAAKERSVDNNQSKKQPRKENKKTKKPKKDQKPILKQPQPQTSQRSSLPPKVEKGKKKRSAPSEFLKVDEDMPKKVRSRKAKKQKVELAEKNFDDLVKKYQKKIDLGTAKFS
eukprot:m.49432 g.49432  ORF g.49432 m.49432 type:complete len:572 (-) comp10615_c0_seq5:5140-6855(-)